MTLVMVVIPLDTVPLITRRNMPRVSLILKLNLVLNPLTLIISRILNLATQSHAPVTLTRLNLGTSDRTLVSLRIVALSRSLLLTSEILRLLWLLPRLHITVLNTLTTMVLISLAVLWVRLYTAFKILIGRRNFVIFEVFGVKLSAKKSILQNCPIKRARRTSRKCKCKKRSFDQKIRFKNLKITKFQRPTKNFERTVTSLAVG